MGLWMWHKETGAFVHVRLGTQHSTPGLSSAGRNGTRGRTRRRTGLGNYAIEDEDDMDGTEGGGEATPIVDNAGTNTQVGKESMGKLGEHKMAKASTWT